VITRSWAAREVANSVAMRPPASLEEVTEQAALRVRVDCKYMVPVEHFGELVARLPQRYRVLEIDGRRAFAYESVYFDTSDLLTYRQHLQGRRRRYKVRTRAYLDTADCVFEVKFNGSRDQTIKAQLPYRITDRTRMTPRARAFLARQLDQAHGQPTPQLSARVATSYQRTTLVDLQRGTRLTCDVDLVCIGSGRRAVGPAHHVLVESKSVEPHGGPDVLLRRLGLRPVQISKYCIAVALLFSAVRSNPWHRTLHRYFTDSFNEQATRFYSLR
jgi:hypothetical protein